jgi:hypothetical protein
MSWKSGTSPIENHLPVMLLRRIRTDCGGTVFTVVGLGTYSISFDNELKEKGESSPSTRRLDSAPAYGPRYSRLPRVHLMVVYRSYGTDSWQILPLLSSGRPKTSSQRPKPQHHQPVQYKHIYHSYLATQRAGSR